MYDIQNIRKERLEGIRLNAAYLGKEKRMGRLFVNNRTLIVPVDDSLIFGPFGGLQELESTVSCIAKRKPTAILGYKGIYAREKFINIPFILNITASTTMGKHLQKVFVSSAKEALVLGADCVAVHINYSSEYENEMLSNLAKTVSEADALGMPVLAISYPRKQKNGEDYNYEDLMASNRDKYTDLVCHCVRTSAEVGADIIKTHYTGDTETFRRVVDSAMGIPVVVAGGPLMEIQDSYEIVKSVLTAGAAGISFGRNVFNSPKVGPYIEGLNALIFNNASVEDAMEIYLSNE